MRRFLVVAALATAACAQTPPKPMVDLKTVADEQVYQRDLIECATLSEYYLVTESNDTINAMRNAAIGGAVAGAGAVILGPTTGSVGADVASGMIAGAITSGIQADYQRELNRNRGVGRCLENRGYEVIADGALFLSPTGWCWYVAVTDDENARCLELENKRQARLKTEREAKRQAGAR